MHIEGCRVCVCPLHGGEGVCVFISDTSSTHTHTHKHTHTHTHCKVKKRPSSVFGGVSVAVQEADPPPGQSVEVLLRQRKPILLQSFSQKPCSHRPGPVAPCCSSGPPLHRDSEENPPLPGDLVDGLPSSLGGMMRTPPPSVVVVDGVMSHAGRGGPQTLSQASTPAQTSR